MPEIDIKKFLLEKKPTIDKVVEKWIPKKFDMNFMDFVFGKTRYQYNVDVVNKTITEPIWEFLERGGKRWRPSLFLLVVEALGGDKEKVFDFVVIPEIIHNGTLFVDDIEDRSELRRGKPCMHLMYGMDVAINTGNTMYYLPLLPLIKHRKDFDSNILLNVYETYVQEMINLGLGQAMDIAWHNGICNADNLSEKEYLQMCAFKTGTLARMSAKIAAILSGADDKLVENLGNYAETIGIAFQIQDDVLNLVEGEFTENKGLGEDITEGKRSLLVINTLNKASQEDRKRLLEILGMHTNVQKLRNEAISIIKKYGSIEYAKEKAKKMIMEAWEGVDKLIPDSDAKLKLKAFTDYLVDRKI
ncbi:MAG: polyprenyl synthetase family protein [Candidatus Aenigmatarchaeota archaeon]